MADLPHPERDIAQTERELRVARLIGFSQRDRELLRLFLRRPPRAGVSLTVVDDDDGHVDLLIANTAAVEAAEALRVWGSGRPAIGIVERFERDAAYYQIAQDGQMLFALAQAINRIRAGWTPPQPTSSTPEPVADHFPSVSAPPAPDAGRYAPSVPPVSVQSAAAPGAAGLGSGHGGNPPSAALPLNKGLPWQRALDILVIDDSHFSREAISAALVKVGFSVNTAENGPEGLRIASEKLFDVALVDFEMPGMQGPEVLRKLRALGAKAPTLLIMLTSRTGAVDRLRAKFAGCDAYLTKPTRMQEFLKILRDFAVAGKLSRP